jgi:tetratricopeptide (TPR) repeat protein
MYFEKTGKVTEAVKNYENLIGDSEVGDRAAYYLGSYYFSIAKYDKARSYLEKVFDYMMSEYKDDALLKIGFSYDEEKNSSRAISSFMRIKLLYSDSPLQDIATLKIAENYESMGDFENAEKNYEDFYINYKNSPYYLTVTEKMININLKKKDLKTAYGYYRELSRLNDKKAKNYESYFKK